MVWTVKGTKNMLACLRQAVPQSHKRLKSGATIRWDMRSKEVIVIYMTAHCIVTQDSGNGEVIVH